MSFLPRRLLLTLCVLGAIGGHDILKAADRGIFSFDDGESIRLTNIPDDKRFRLLIEDLVTLPEPKGGLPIRRASRSPSVVASQVRAFHPLIERIALAHRVPLMLVHAVIAAESRYDPDAVSPKGAIGLMQLIPGTAKRYGVQNLHDPKENIEGGVRYLRDLLDMFDNNVELTLAAYNAGENAVIKYGRKIPPYKETEGYVSAVLDWQKRLQPAILTLQ